MLAGGNRAHLYIRIHGVSPKRAEYRRRQIVHDDIARRINRHGALVQDKGVPIFEDRHFLDRHPRQSPSLRRLLRHQHGTHRNQQAHERGGGT